MTKQILNLAVCKNCCIVAMEKCIKEWINTVIKYCRRSRSSAAVNIIKCECMGSNLNLVVHPITITNQTLRSRNLEVNLKIHQFNPSFVSQKTE